MEATRPKNRLRDMVKVRLSVGSATCLAKGQGRKVEVVNISYVVENFLGKCVHACLFGLLLKFVCFQTRGVDSVFLFSKLVYDTNQKERFEINTVYGDRDLPTNSSLACPYKVLASGLTRELCQAACSFVSQIKAPPVLTLEQTLMRNWQRMC